MYTNKSRIASKLEGNINRVTHYTRYTFNQLIQSSKQFLKSHFSINEMQKKYFVVVLNAELLKCNREEK